MFDEVNNDVRAAPEENKIGLGKIREWFQDAVDKSRNWRKEAKEDYRFVSGKQWKNAEAIFIYMPLHNFNVVSKFKDYIDNIMIVNEIFKCEIETMLGLDNPDKQVTFVLTSGGEFDSHIQYVNLDFTVQYVRGILSLLGIEKMKLIRVQGLDLAHNNKDAIVEKSKEELKSWIAEFSKKNN